MERTIELSELWSRMWAYRRSIAIFVFAVTLLTAAVAFMLPPWYEATASLLPPSEEDSSLGGCCRSPRSAVG